MSPTEDDLRHALAHGAGDVPDADRIVSVAHEHRARRRTRLLSGAAAVIVVGGVATGGTLLAQRGSSSGASGDASANSQAGPAADAPSGQEVACPSQLPHTLLPGGGGTSQFGSTGKIFTQPVDTVTVCAYPSEAAGSPKRVELTGSDATTFADSLENASTTAIRGACEDFRLATQETLSIIATTADGKQLPRVTTTINEPVCAVQVTNGTAVRYGWSWPSSLHDQLSQVTDAGSPVSSSSSSSSSNSSDDPIGSITSPGRVDGSPAH